jgi:MFS family permease
MRAVRPGEASVSTIAWYTVGVLALSNACAYLDQSVLGVLAEPIKRSLRLNDLQLGLLQGPAFALSYALFSIPMARLADRGVRKTLLGAALAGWTLMTGLCGLTSSFLALAMARVGVGIGQAALVPAGNSMIADLFGASSFGRATGIFMLGGAAGAGLILIAGGATLAHLRLIAASLGWPAGLPEWRLAFLALVLPGMLFVALLFGTVREPVRLELTVSSAITAMPRSLSGLWKSHPRAFNLLLLASCLISIVVQSWLAWAPAFLMRKFHIGLGEAAYWYGLDILTFACVGTILAGVLIDRLFRRGHADAAMRMAIAGCLGCTALATLVATLSMKYAVILSFGLLLFSTSLVSVALPPLISMLVPNRVRGQAIAVLLLLSGIVGMAIGPAVVGTLADLMPHPGSLDRALLLMTLTIGPAAVYAFQRSRRAFQSVVVAASGLPERDVGI